jgi:hypothetical protein
MAGPFHLELLTELFNKIGPKRRLVRCSGMSGVEVIAEVANARSK